jgi:Fe-S oxidoreductase
MYTSATAMTLILVIALGIFAWSAYKRSRLLFAAPGIALNNVSERFRGTMQLAFGQKKLTRFTVAGLAHKAIFFGFIVLMLRTLILISRAYTDQDGFGLWLFNDDTTLGFIYNIIKDVYVVLVMLGVSVFLWMRLVSKPKRLKPSCEALFILWAIFALMVADLLIDLPVPPIISQFGFWVHVILVFVLLNILPYSKHFHIITAVPNVFVRKLEPSGYLKPIDDIEGRLEREEPLGVQFVSQFDRGVVLDLYSCTECGRCTSRCPANNTGKELSPRDMLCDIRDHLYERADDVVTGGELSNLIPGVVSEESLWACTTCGACEEECPVMIGHIQRIVDMRRHLVQEKGEFPEPLMTTFQNLEMTGNPWGLPPEERLSWTEGLDVPTVNEVPDPDVLLWVGCAPAMDAKSKVIAQSMAQLLSHSGVKWAILGELESCTGDVARRGGNEYLFEIMAKGNIETLNGVGAKTIVTACPHCFNTLKNEYPDFGGCFNVVHHSVYLEQLIAEGKLKPTRQQNTTVTFQDPCYLGRHNGEYDAPRKIMQSIGLDIIEAPSCKDRGVCCGAGGAQFFKEPEEGNEQINDKRTKQLVDTGADTLATACPFCLRMMADSLATEEHKSSSLAQHDIAELLLGALSDCQ